MRSVGLPCHAVLLCLVVLMGKSFGDSSNKDSHDRRSLCHANDVFEEEEPDAEPGLGYTRLKPRVLLQACSEHLHLAGGQIGDSQVMMLFAALEAQHISPRTITLSHNTLGEPGLGSVARHASIDKTPTPHATYHPPSGS